MCETRFNLHWHQTQLHSADSDTPPRSTRGEIENLNSAEKPVHETEKLKMCRVPYRKVNWLTSENFYVSRTRAQMNRFISATVHSFRFLKRKVYEKITIARPWRQSQWIFARVVHVKEKAQKKIGQSRKHRAKNVFEFVPEEWKKLKWERKKEIQAVPPGKKTITIFSSSTRFN